jgi:hypothetical protein
MRPSVIVPRQLSTCTDPRWRTLREYVKTPSVTVLSKRC